MAPKVIFYAFLLLVSYLPFSFSAFFSLRFHRPVRSYQAVPTHSFRFFFPFALPCFFIGLGLLCLGKKKTGHYALSSLGFFFLLPSRHHSVSSASRACGTPT